MENKNETFTILFGCHRITSVFVDECLVLNSPPLRALPCARTVWHVCAW